MVVVLQNLRANIDCRPPPLTDAHHGMKGCQANLFMLVAKELTDLFHCLSGMRALLGAELLDGGQGTEADLDVLVIPRHSNRHFDSLLTLLRRGAWKRSRYRQPDRLVGIMEETLQHRQDFRVASHRLADGGDSLAGLAAHAPVLVLQLGCHSMQGVSHKLDRAVLLQQPDRAAGAAAAGPVRPCELRGSKMHRLLVSSPSRDDADRLRGSCPGPPVVLPQLLSRDTERQLVISGRQRAQSAYSLVAYLCVHVAKSKRDSLQAARSAVGRDAPERGDRIRTRYPSEPKATVRSS
mmetsp:Transcript_97887/g.176683  ORF Transcript_97887/g.176683 Transcript_97887/m.176683 type:complete len:294 (+) Transcript_97887:466-1347(+)